FPQRRQALHPCLGFAARRSACGHHYFRPATGDRSRHLRRSVSVQRGHRIRLREWTTCPRKRKAYRRPSRSRVAPSIRRWESPRRESCGRFSSAAAGKVKVTNWIGTPFHEYKHVRIYGTRYLRRKVCDPNLCYCEVV